MIGDLLKALSLCAVLTLSSLACDGSGQIDPGDDTGSDTTDDTSSDMADDNTPADNSAAGTTKTVTATVTVKAGTTYDGKGVTIKASGLGDGGQGESQKPIFKLEDGATLKNVKIAYPGADGIHVYGAATLENVIWEDVGEDAMTVKEGTINKTVTLTNCKAYKADDKILQVNAPITLTLNNFYADTFGKVIRQNGDTTFKAALNFNGGTFKNGTNLARTDSSTTQIRYRNITTSNVKELWVVPNSSQVKQY